MKMKKFLAGITALVLSFSAFTGCGSTSQGDGAGEVSNDGSEVTKVIIGTQEMPNDEGISKALDYFKDEMGVDVELKKFDSGKDVNTAIASGSIDFGLMGTCPASLAIAQDLGVEFIWIHEVLGSVESLVARNETGITAVADLKGKKVAVPFASTAHFSLLKAIEDAGMTAEDVEILDLATDKIYASWENGDIDAAYIWQPTLAELKDQTVILTSEDMADKGYMTANVEVVRKEFADANPEIVAGYIRALDKAVKLYNSDKSAAVSAISSSMQLEESDAEFQMAGSKWLTAEEQTGADYLGTSEAKGAVVKNLMDTAEFLKSQGSIQEVPAREIFEAAVNPSYIEAALK
ncbi:MAG: MetQ/NlpA family ABC transporter substrate-binding protein [Clostridia bacterium]|nr:MetQ/NlpA family ABC transporter substrate-binding protein [Clostridia bacterium]